MLLKVLQCLTFVFCVSVRKRFWLRVNCGRHEDLDDIHDRDGPSRFLFSGTGVERGSYGWHLVCDLERLKRRVCVQTPKLQTYGHETEEVGSEF